MDENGKLSELNENFSASRESTGSFYGSPSMGVMCLES